jgi:ubiquinone/menaquinone biosynthesis C-methylase UbiE
MGEEKGMSRFLSMGNYEEKRYSFIASFFKEVKGRFLDIGCHSGALSKYLHSELEYFGIDGIDNGFKNYVKADLNAKRLPFTDNMFDAINCSAVLEHLFYPHDILKEMKRLLKDGGTILVSLPNDKSLNALFSQLFVGIRPYDKNIHGHHWKFSIKTAQEFFEKEFKVIREEPEYGPLFRKYLPFLKFKLFCTEWFMLGVKK